MYSGSDLRTWFCDASWLFEALEDELYSMNSRGYTMKPAFRKLFTITPLSYSSICDSIRSMSGECSSRSSKWVSSRSVICSANSGSLAIA